MHIHPDQGRILTRHMNKSVIAALSIFLCAFFLHGSCSNKSPLGQARPDSLVYKHAPEGDLKLHFHYPGDWSPDDKRPLIVFFFGGGWRGGTVEQFRTQAEYLAERGMVTARADYRVFNRHGTMPDKCVEDGKSAVRWLRENAAMLGADPDMIAAAGGSAGGHVAICTRVVEGLEAGGEDLSVSSWPNLLVLFNPVLRTTSEQFIERLGSEEAALQISPVDHLDESVPPMIMFFGSDDMLIEYAYDYLDSADALGLVSRLWIADGQVHAFFNKSPWLESTLLLADQFLVEHGYLEGDPTISMPQDGEMHLYQRP